MEDMQNKAVITTKYVLENEAPIVYIYRDEDGDWQFFSEEGNTSAADARVAKMIDILSLDPTVGKALMLGKKMRAWRKTTADEWVMEMC